MNKGWENFGEAIIRSREMVHTAEEFEFSEKRIENDDTHEKLAEILGENFDDDWEVELDEE